MNFIMMYLLDQSVQMGRRGTFEGVNKNNCCRSFFCMLITKKLSIQTDSEALCPYLGIKFTWSFHYDYNYVAGQILRMITKFWMVSMDEISF